MGFFDKFINRKEKENIQINSNNSINLDKSINNIVPSDNQFIKQRIDQLASPSKEVRLKAISDLQQEGIKSFDNIKDIIFLCAGKNNDIISRVGSDIVPLFYRYYPKEIIELLVIALKSNDLCIRTVAERAFHPYLLGGYKDRDPAVNEAVNLIEESKNIKNADFKKGFSCYKCNKKLPKSEMMKNAFGIDAYEGLQCSNCGKAICLSCNPKNNGRCSACGGTLTAIHTH